MTAGARTAEPSEHLDVLIVGGGLSGIGAAHHLQDAHGRRSFAILEARESIGGTWDLFRYPGVRSDSDMQTLAYRFRPWRESKALAGGEAILEYVCATAREAGIDRHVRLGHRVKRAEWSSEDARWTVEATRRPGAETVRLTCGFLLMCTGYYRYDHGHTPDFEGTESFSGAVIHPQLWPPDLDYDGKRVAVVGSGATAVTLVPALADRAAHVTMVQRSPSYIVTMPAEDPIAGLLRRLLGDRAAYAITRWKNVAMAAGVYGLSQRRPRLVRALIRAGTKYQLPAEYDVDTHFRPPYDPWDQRMCLVPDGDLFKAISGGRASIATGQIETFTESGIRMESGEEIAADIIVTATGLRMLAFGDVALNVDGEDVALPETLAYKGLMLSGIPNLAYTLGYTNASWTLKADLVSEYVCRLLTHMDRRGYEACVPVNEDPAAPTRPLLDLAAGYVQRSIDTFPRSGTRAPWQHGKSYGADILSLRYRPIEDPALRFTRRARARSERVAAAV